MSDLPMSLYICATQDAALRCIVTLAPLSMSLRMPEVGGSETGSQQQLPTHSSSQAGQCAPCVTVLSQQLHSARDVLASRLRCRAKVSYSGSSQHSTPSAALTPPRIHTPPGAICFWRPVSNSRDRNDASIGRQRCKSRHGENASASNGKHCHETQYTRLAGE